MDNTLPFTIVLLTPLFNLITFLPFYYREHYLAIRGTSAPFLPFYFFTLLLLALSCD